ncbi:hypothetical protein NQZ68_029270 [Dissostichus eleginoides]|nr:hypothetical protein NQZ68_029270 [Dissostichus eleginoides]
MVWMLVLLLGQQPSARDQRDPPPAVCGSPLLGHQPSARTRSPTMVWVEVLLLGRQPSARDRRDPLVVLAVQLASLFGSRQMACGAQRLGRQPSS